MKQLWHISEQELISLRGYILIELENDNDLLLNDNKKERQKLFITDIAIAFDKWKGDMIKR